MRSVFDAIMILIWCAAMSLAPEAAANSLIPPHDVDSATVASDHFSRIPSAQLRTSALHDAGKINMMIGPARFPANSSNDPETGIDQYYELTFPNGTNRIYCYSMQLWIGGVVDGDTLLSTGDGSPIYYNYNQDFWPPLPDSGGMRRTGRFADDEFEAAYTDTVTESRYVNPNPYNSTHVPLGIRVTQTSYSWCDTAYSDFIIMTFRVDNIGHNQIHNGWIGFYADPDIYTYVQYYYSGAQDDATGVLDTFLDARDPSHRTLIPYTFDNDGDPNLSGVWDTNSVRGVFSIRLLDASIQALIENYNWFATSTTYGGDFGPRRLGTLADPYRQFSNSTISTPVSSADRYYLLSHSEIDYPSLEIAVHDSSDGWNSCGSCSLGETFDVKSVYSFGPFDLAPGDSLTFAIAIACADNFHANPDDFKNYYDPLSPRTYESKLDFSGLMTAHRRADSVYRSGFSLPIPGPPAGIHIVQSEDEYVTLTWNRSWHKGLKGYHVYVKDTVFDNIWRRAYPHLLTDTTCLFHPAYPTHRYFFAVTTVDTLGRESDLSFLTSVIPAAPHTPTNLTLTANQGIPELRWRPYCDTLFETYVVYRALWSGSFARYDSTSGYIYRDFGAESGVTYHYAITAENDQGVESPPTDSVSIMPMALNKGALFYDMNYHYTVNLDSYHNEYIDRLYAYLSQSGAFTRRNVDDGLLTFKEMSNYGLIVFDCEQRGGMFPEFANDSIRIYLDRGGKALFILPNMSTIQIAALRPHINRFSDGNFFHDYLLLDSSVTNAMVIFNYILYGDLMGCRSHNAAYPDLSADLAKLTTGPIPIDGYIPFSGCLFPRDSADTIYAYQSSYPDSSFNGQINGIKNKGDSCRVIIFNFPLSLMSEPTNLMALRQALTDLGMDFTCGDVNGDNVVNIGDIIFLINYLYRSGPAPEAHRADVNCDGVADLEDVLVIVNRIFRKGVPLACCP